MSEATDRLLAIMDRLRDPSDGCPWDIEQTFRTIAPHTIEEAFEVAEAIETDDLQALKDELGDLLFQVAFHARLAKEAGAFDYEAVANAICEKMIRRHPHVFGEARIDDAKSQVAAWETTKAAERAAKAEKNGPPSALDGVSTALPAQTRALKLQARAARVGFDWPDWRQVVAKIDEEIGELREEVETGGTAERIAEEMGDVLFACVNLARKLGVDPETALRTCNRKFERRFRFIEKDLDARGRSIDDASLDEMEALWVRAKDTEKPSLPRTDEDLNAG